MEENVNRMEENAERILSETAKVESISCEWLKDLEKYDLTEDEAEEVVRKTRRMFDLNRIARNKSEQYKFMLNS